MQIDELARAYQAKSDEEIVVLAKKPEDLTPEAQSLLRGELARRRITVDSAPVQEQSELVTVLSKIPVPEPVVQGAKSSGEFLKEVTLLYRDHFWLFIKLVAPAVVIGYVLVVELNSWFREVSRHIWQNPAPGAENTMLLQIAIVGLSVRVLSGLLFCFSFAMICSAVGRICKGAAVPLPEVLRELKEHLSRVFIVSFVLLVLISVALSLTTVVAGVLFWLGPRFHFHPTFYVNYGVSFTTLFLLTLLISRLALAMPAVILDNYRIGQAFFRSDELTQGKWIELASLLAKSVIGGYVAGMLPFWAAELLWRWVHLPEWGLDAASVLGVTMVEPFMFIGFALMYVQAREYAGD